jgi:hypothetical protein
LTLLKNNILFEEQASKIKGLAALDLAAVKNFFFSHQETSEVLIEPNFHPSTLV